MKQFLLIIGLLQGALSFAQGIENGSVNPYQIRVVYRGKILAEGKLLPGGNVYFPCPSPIEIFYKRLTNECDETNPKTPHILSLPNTPYRNVQLPNGWKMIKVNPGKMVYAPLYFCSRA